MGWNVGILLTPELSHTVSVASSVVHSDSLWSQTTEIVREGMSFDSQRRQGAWISSNRKISDSTAPLDQFFPITSGLHFSFLIAISVLRNQVVGLDQGSTSNPANASHGDQPMEISICCRIDIRGRLSGAPFVFGDYT